MVKNPPASTGDTRDVGLVPESGRSPGGENGNPLQYSCLENSMDKEASQATVHGVTKSQTQLSTHAHTGYRMKEGFFGGSDGKESACNVGDPDSILRRGRFPGEGNGYPLQYSCLENSMNRGGWWATVHGVTKSLT